MTTQLPANPDRRALVAIDLGAESCRVSLLRWSADKSIIELLHRIPNGPVAADGSLRWALDRILVGLEEGLRKAAAAAPEGIRSIAVDGWAVDYVRLAATGKPLAAPFCYRDDRTNAAKAYADALMPPRQLLTQTGAQPLRINTLYQLIADSQACTGVSTHHTAPWLLLPEYILHWLGSRRVAEYTNATHTGLVDLATRNWSPALFKLYDLDFAAAPSIVPTGTILGKLTARQSGNGLAQLPAFRDTNLIAPACHDTASAIAAMPGNANTAYIVSGTWSLVGAVVDSPITTPEAFQSGFTNQGAATGGYCFHTNVNGMWILKQCFDQWNAEGRNIDLLALVAQAAQVKSIPGIINVDDPSLLLTGEMPTRINRLLESRAIKGTAHAIPDRPGNEPIFARLIFESLAVRYAEVLRNLASLTGRRFTSITILGGGSRNAFLRRLTETATGLSVTPGEAEGSTLGNFAVQLAAQSAQPGTPAFHQEVHRWASILHNVAQSA
jgi:rhamnulokinase